MTFVIDPETSFLYFKYMSVIKNQLVYYFIKGHQLANWYMLMRNIFDNYKTEERWLLIKMEIRDSDIYSLCFQPIFIKPSHIEQDLIKLRLSAQNKPGTQIKAYGTDIYVLILHRVRHQSGLGRYLCAQSVQTEYYRAQIMLSIHTIIHIVQHIDILVNPAWKLYQYNIYQVSVKLQNRAQWKLFVLANHYSLNIFSVLFCFLTQVQYNKFLILLIINLKEGKKMHNELNQQLEDNELEQHCISYMRSNEQNLTKQKDKTNNREQEIPSLKQHVHLEEQHKIRKNREDVGQSYSNNGQIINKNQQGPSAYKKQSIHFEDQQEISKPAYSQGRKEQTTQKLTQITKQPNIISQQKIAWNQQNLQTIKNQGLVSNTRNAIPQYEVQEKVGNKYTYSLGIAHQYLKILRISYYACLLRFIFIVFVYYNVDFIVSKPLDQRQTYNRTTQTNSTDIIEGVDQSIKESAKLYEPWNVMIYFLSGSIDMISVIGYISAIRFLKSQIKVLENKEKMEEERIKAERRLAERQRQRDRRILEIYRRNRNLEGVNEAQIQIEPENQQPQAQQLPTGIVISLNVRQRTIRIGKESTYMSIYSAIRQYKYKNKDQSAAFKITKIMHITATFLFFGRMALIEQYQSEGRIDIKGNLIEQSSWKEFTLWLFLTTAYLASFQIDFFKLESSTGPYIKIQKFHFSKISQIYSYFEDWRKKYSVFLQIGSVLAAICIFSEIVSNIIDDSGITIMLFTKILLIISGISVLKQNNEIVKNSSTYIQQKSSQHLNEAQNYNKTTPSYNQFHTKQIYNLQKMMTYKNLSLLGILRHHSTNSQYGLIFLHRLILFLYGLSILRESDTSNIKVYTFCINLSVFLAFFVGEMWKFHTVMNSHLNLLDSCKFKDMKYLKQEDKQKSIVQFKQNQIIEKQSKQSISRDSKHQLTKKQSIKRKQNFGRNNHEYSKQSSGTTCCSVCLNEYEADQNVIIICCGHIFHEDCLLDWLKQKKECPLCRLNIEEYYQEISF